jgi:hypothetical protein
MTASLAVTAAANTTQTKDVQFHCGVPGFSSPGQNRANGVVFTLVEGNWEFEAVCGCGEVVTSYFSNSSNELNGNNIQVKCFAAAGRTTTTTTVEETWTVASVTGVATGAGLYKNATGNNNTLRATYSVTVNFVSNLGNTATETFGVAPFTWGEFGQNNLNKVGKAAATSTKTFEGSVETVLAGTVDYTITSTANVWLENRGHSAFDAFGERLTTATVTFTGTTFEF